MDSELRADIEALESELADIQSRLAVCAQAMMLSRVAIGLGLAAMFAVIALVTVSDRVVIVLLGFSAMVGGTVWFGANKTTREELLERRSQVETQRHQLFDAAARASGWGAAARTAQ